jgi:protoporphyrinogen/coproporphyrinogen III oxidase
MFHFPRGIPVYQRGYQEHLEGVRRRLAAFPPIALCGSGYDGPGLSASVRSAKAAAALVLAARRG